jgi:hypothetical protein
MFGLIWFSGFREEDLPGKYDLLSKYAQFA